MNKHKSKARNYLHNHPLLQKGGIHQKTKKAIRRQDKIKLKKEWLPKSRLPIIVF